MITAYEVVWFYRSKLVRICPIVFEPELGEGEFVYTYTDFWFIDFSNDGKRGKNEHNDV